MPNDEFQKARPQIQKELSVSDARSETLLPLPDDNRVQRSRLFRNPMARIALCLGVVSPILSVLWVKASFPLGPMTGIGGLLQLVLGLTTLVFGILGYRYKNPTFGGFGASIFGIGMGILTTLCGLFLCLFFLGICLLGGGAWK